MTTSTDTLTIEKVVAPDITLTAETPEKIALLTQQLDAMSKTRKDWIVQSQHISYAAGSEPGDIALVIDFGGATGMVRYPSITRHAHRQMATAMSVPWDYYQRMLLHDPELLASNLNVWLHKPSKQSGYAGKMYEVRTIMDRVRAWLGDSYLNLDNDPLFFHSYETLKDVNASIVRADLTETTFYLRALKADWAMRLQRQKDIAKTSKQMMEGYGDSQGIHYDPATAGIGDRTGGDGGVMYKASRDPDLMIPGICIANSEVGARSFTVDAVIFRPYCRNTAVFGERIARVHRSSRHDVPGLLSDATKRLEADLIWSETRDLIRAVFDMDIFKKFVEKMSMATGMVLDNPIEAVDSVVKNYKITDADKQRILNELVSGGDPTVFGLMQAITATARDKNNYDDAYPMEKIGAEFMESMVDANGNPARELVVVRR